MCVRWKRFGITLCWLVSLSSPLAVLALTMTYGATEWRYDDEPVPVAAYIIDAVFLADLCGTILLLRWSRGECRLVAAFLAVPLLCLTGVGAFWGGLWVSGQWL